MDPKVPVTICDPVTGPVGDIPGSMVQLPFVLDCGVRGRVVEGWNRER
jgi:hypothetical protein